MVNEAKGIFFKTGKGLSFFPLTLNSLGKTGISVYF